MRRLPWLALLLGCADVAAPDAPLTFARIPARAFLWVGGQAYAVATLPAEAELRVVSVAATMTARDTVQVVHPDLPTLTALAPDGYAGPIVSTLTVRYRPGGVWRGRLAMRGTPTLEAVTIGWCLPAACAQLDTWSLR